MTSRPLRVGSRLERVLASGRFAVTAEVTPNTSGSPDSVRGQARAMKGHIDACNVTDCQRALVKISSLAAAALVLDEGVEPVMQVVTRDRNRIALQADLLGAHALGVRNLVCLRGDDVKEGNEPEAKPVLEFTTEEFIALVKKLRDQGTLSGGDVVDNPPNFFIGAASNPFEESIEESVVRLRGKVDAGADFVQTQAIYDMEQFEEWMRLVRKEWLHEKVDILAGVIPLKSVKMAKFLAENVPGVVVPSRIVEHIAKASDPKAAGLRIALDTINALRDVEGVRGVHIMAISWEDIVPELVKDAGLFPRPE